MTCDITYVLLLVITFPYILIALFTKWYFKKLRPRKLAPKTVVKIAAKPHIIDTPIEYMASDKYSMKSILWLEYVMVRDDIEIHHAENSGELIIRYIDEFGHNRRFYADGFCEETNTVYEFHGTMWHGHPSYFDANEYSTILKRTYGDAYRDTLAREALIKTKYNLVVMWEHDWDKLVRRIN